MAFESLLLLHVENELNNEEVLFFPDNEQYRNLEMPDQSYSSFDLSKYENDECLGNFRFVKKDQYNLVGLSYLPTNELIFPNVTKAFVIIAISLIIVDKIVKYW